MRLYQEDLAKYDDENHEKASVVFKTIPEQLENKNSHFKMSKVDKNARYQNYIDAISFISESMIGNECINVTHPEISLELYADRSNFKLYMMDTLVENVQETLTGTMTVVRIWSILSQLRRIMII